VVPAEGDIHNALADTAGNDAGITVKRRNDPWIVRRIIPVAEAMPARVLADALPEQAKYRN
jgi:chorismate synthase